MRAPKRKDARQQKDAKQKKLLLVLVPVLVILLAWQGSGMLKAFRGSEPSPPTSSTTASSETAAASAAATSSTQTSTEPSSASTSATAAPPAPGGAPQELPDTDVPPPAASGKLVSFDRFAAKDPFKQQLSTSDQPAAGTSAASPPAPVSPPPPAPVSPPPTATETAPAPTAAPAGSSSPTLAPTETNASSPPIARMNVNGAEETVTVGAAFPSRDPIFRLVSVSRRAARIGLVSGSFTNGEKTLKVEVGGKLTLVRRPDGLRYTIHLLSVS